MNSIDEFLDECLDTLKAIGVASAMSINAHRRIFRYVQLLREMCESMCKAFFAWLLWFTNILTLIALGPGDQATELEPVDTIPTGARETPSGQTLLTTENGDLTRPSFISDDSIDFFTQVNEHDLIYGNWLGPNFGPNEFDVIGYI